MRITFVEFAPSGGLFQFSFQLGEALARRGHEVELLTGPDPELEAQVPGFVVASVLRTWHPGAAGVEPRLRRRVRRVARAVQYVDGWRCVVAHLRASPPDVVVWSNWRFWFDGQLIAWLARQPDRPRLAFVCHEPRPLSEQQRRGSLYRSGVLLKRSLERAFASVDAVFVLGEGARRELLELWPQVRRVAVIPHGDEAVFAREAVPPADASPPTVLFFGTWTRSKGLDVLLDAFAQVRNALPDARLVLAGTVGADIDFARIEQRASALGDVELRPGYVPLPAVPALMAQTRVVVLPYLRANQSGVAHLAQTFARPLVATAVGDIPAAVTDGVSGLLVPPGDPTALAVALARLLRNPHEAARMGLAGRKRVTAEASWAQVAERVDAALTALRGAEGVPEEAGGAAGGSGGEAVGDVD